MTGKNAQIDFERALFLQRLLFMRQAIIIGNIEKIPEIYKCLKGWALRQCHDYDSMRRILNEQNQSQSETLIIISTSRTHHCITEKLSFLTKNYRVRFMVIVQMHDFTSQYTIGRGTLWISQRLVQQQLPLIERWIQSSVFHERHFIRKDCQGHLYLRPSSFCQRPTTTDVPAVFCDISSQGACVQVNLGALKVNDFIQVQYESEHQQITRIESQIRWVQHLGAVSVLGLRFLAFSS